MKCRVAEAGALLSRLEGLNPIDTRHAELNALAGQAEASIELLKHYLEHRRDDINHRIHLATMYAAAGNPEAAYHLELAEVFMDTANGEFSVPKQVLVAGLIYVYGRIGMEDRASVLFEELLAAQSGRLPRAFAPLWVVAYIGIGETEEALYWTGVIAEDELSPFLSPQLHIMLNSYQDPTLDTPPFVELRCEMGYRDETNRLRCP